MKKKKKFYWERDVFKPSKAKKKKAIIYKENDFGFYFFYFFFLEINDLTFQYPKYQLGFFMDFSKFRCFFFFFKFDISIIH